MQKDVKKNAAKSYTKINTQKSEGRRTGERFTKQILSKRKLMELYQYHIG
jgi:hypothetical protein